MPLTKLLSIFLCFCLILEQSVFAQAIDLSHYFVHNSNQNIRYGDKFRPLHLRYISYDNQADDFKILLDKGDFFNQKTEKPKNEKTLELENTTQELMKYFFVGLALPNEKFWVNLRPDSPDNILDPELEKTDIGRIFLEADLQLKKDTSGMTSPQTKEGREYWDKLYKKAGELFGNENITIPTITRPWIVPNEIIIREAPDNAYIYKATLKVMLEEDYLENRKTEKIEELKNQRTDWHSFSDPRLKELNQYSTQLIKEAIIPKLTYAVNTAKRYAPLRQVYYSLILAQWFKQKYGSVRSTRASDIIAPVNSYIDLIDSGNLANLTSSQPYDKQSYFQQYQKSFKDGEYNLQEPIYTPLGQSIRRYTSGGGNLTALMANSSIVAANRKDLMPAKHMSSPVKVVDANVVLSPIRFPELPVLSSSEEQVFYDAAYNGRELFSKLLAGRIALFSQENISFPEKMNNRCKVKRLRNYYSFKGEQAYLVELPGSNFAANKGINVIAIVSKETNKIIRVYMGSPKKISPAVALYRELNKENGKPVEFLPNEDGEDFIEIKEGYGQEADDIRKALIELLDSAEALDRFVNNGAGGHDFIWEVLEAPRTAVMLESIKKTFEGDANIANAISHTLSLSSARGFNFIDGVLYLKAKNVEGGHYRPLDGSIFIRQNYGLFDIVETFIHELWHHVFHTLSPYQRATILEHFGKKFKAMQRIFEDPLYKEGVLIIDFKIRMGKKGVALYESLINEVFAYTLTAVVLNIHCRLSFDITEDDIRFLKEQGLLPGSYLGYKYAVKESEEISGEDFTNALVKAINDARIDMFKAFSQDVKKTDEEKAAQEWLEGLFKVQVSYKDIIAMENSAEQPEGLRPKTFPQESRTGQVIKNREEGGKGYPKVEKTIPSSFTGHEADQLSFEPAQQLTLDPSWLKPTLIDRVWLFVRYWIVRIKINAVLKDWRKAIEDSRAARNKELNKVFLLKVIRICEDAGHSKAVYETWNDLIDWSYGYSLEELKYIFKQEHERLSPFLRENIVSFICSEEMRGYDRRNNVVGWLGILKELGAQEETMINFMLSYGDMELLKNKKLLEDLGVEIDNRTRMLFYKMVFNEGTGYVEYGKSSALSKIAELVEQSDADTIKFILKKFAPNNFRGAEALLILYRRFPEVFKGEIISIFKDKTGLDFSEQLLKVLVGIEKAMRHKVSLMFSSKGDNHGDKPKETFWTDEQAIPVLEEILETNANKLEVNNMSVHSMVNVIDGAGDRSVFLLKNSAGNLEKISDLIIDLSAKPYEIGLSVIELPDNRVFFILAKGNNNNNDPLPGFLNGFTPWIRMYFHTHPPNESNDAYDNFVSIRSSGDVLHFHWAAHHNRNKGYPVFFILHRIKGETALAKHKIEAPLKNLEGNSADGETGKELSNTNKDTKRLLNDIFLSVLSISSEENNGFVEKDNLSVSSSINQNRLDSLFENLKKETVSSRIDGEIREIFEILSEDKSAKLSKDQIVPLINKMKECSENFSLKYDAEFILDDFFYAEGIDMKELTSLFLGLVYSTKSKKLRDDFLSAMASGVNVDKVIKLSQKQFDDLINFMGYYLEGDDAYSARGWIANILSGTLNQKEVNITQGQLNMFIKALDGVNMDYHENLNVLMFFGPDDFNIMVGIRFVSVAIRKNKELVIDQPHFDILLEALPKIIDFKRTVGEVQGALKLILRRNSGLKLLKNSFLENDAIVDFCNQLERVVKNGKKVKVKIVPEDLKSEFGSEIEIEAYDLKDLREMIGEEIEYHHLGSVVIYINGKDLEDLSPNQLLDYKTEVIIKDKEAGSPVVSIVQNHEKPGGIAFNALPIQTESVASSALGALSGARAFRGDLDVEWTQIQQIFNAGIRPSIQRLSEYTAAAVASPLAEDKIDQVRVMLADILRRDEESEMLAPAEESCKQFLRALEWNVTIPT